MPKVERLLPLRRKLEQLKKKAADNNVSVVVGYTQFYGLYVHETPPEKAKHAAGKSWKFLEFPARRLAKELADIVVTVYKKTGTLCKGLLMAGLRLQRASQEMVPIDTAALKASAYTAYEADKEQAYAQAHLRSEAVRVSELARREKQAQKRAARVAKDIAKRAASKVKNALRRKKGKD